MTGVQEHAVTLADRVDALSGNYRVDVGLDQKRRTAPAREGVMGGGLRGEFRQTCVVTVIQHERKDSSVLDFGLVSDWDAIITSARGTRRAARPDATF